MSARMMKGICKGRCALAGRVACCRAFAASLLRSRPGLPALGPRRQDHRPVPVQGPGRDDQLLGHLVRPVPAGNAAARGHLQEVQAHGLHHARRQRRAGLQGRRRPGWASCQAGDLPGRCSTSDSKVSKLYKVAGMPSTVFVDRKGNVRVLHRGYKPGDENYLSHADPRRC